MSSQVPAILGGDKVRTRPFEARVTMGAEEKDAVAAVMDSDCLSAFIGGPHEMFLGGERVRAMEHAFAEYTGYRHAISVNSWTSGLVAAVGAAGVGPGDEVICSPYTMSASATCALFWGGIPIFADIDPETFCLDPASIEARITERTKAIVVVHLFGHPANMAAIGAIAKNHGLRVIEDAAQAPGVLYEGRQVGGLVDLGGYSLNFHKHIHTGEGGVIVTDDDDLAWRCQLIRNHGENCLDGYEGDDISNLIGGNYRLTELQAAVGVEQLKRLPGHLETRQALAARLTERLRDVDGVYPPEVAEGCTHAYYTYPIRYDEEVVGIPRSLFARAVAAELPDPWGIEATPLFEGYVRPLYLARTYQERIAIGSEGFPFNQNPGIEYRYEKGLCPVAERMHEEELLWSPLVREPLQAADMDDFASAIEKVVGAAARIRSET